MPVVWKKEFSTGVLWQDNQHKELLRRINKLHDAMAVGLGKEELMKLFDFLDDYIVVHFDAEEKAMHKSEYPGTLEHIKEHTEFIEDVARFKKEVTHGATAALIIQVNRRIVDWIINHISVDDKKMGEHVIKRMNDSRG